MNNIWEVTFFELFFFNEKGVFENLLCKICTKSFVIALYAIWLLLSTDIPERAVSEGFTEYRYRS